MIIAHNQILWAHWLQTKPHNSKVCALLYKESSSSYDQIKDFGLGSKCCACLMYTTFLCYSWLYTSVCLVVSLEWGIQGLYIIMVSFDLRCENNTYISCNIGTSDYNILLVLTKLIVCIHLLRYLNIWILKSGIAAAIIDKKSFAWIYSMKIWVTPSHNKAPTLLHMFI